MGARAKLIRYRRKQGAHAILYSWDGIHNCRLFFTTTCNFCNHILLGQTEVRFFYRLSGIVLLLESEL